MRALRLAALLALPGAAVAQPNDGAGTLLLCQEMDRPACAAWAAGVAAPVAVIGLALLADAAGQPGLGTGLGVAALVVGPAAGFVVAGHAREALPGLAVRGAALAATAALIVALPDRSDGAGGVLVHMLVLAPGLTAFLLSDRRDTRHLRRLLQDDTLSRAMAQTPEGTNRWAGRGTVLRMVVPF